MCFDPPSSPSLVSTRVCSFPTFDRNFSPHRVGVDWSSYSISLQCDAHPFHLLSNLQIIRGIHPQEILRAGVDVHKREDFTLRLDSVAQMGNWWKVCVFLALASSLIHHAAQAGKTLARNARLFMKQNHPSRLSSSLKINKNTQTSDDDPSSSSSSSSSQVQRGRNDWWNGWKCRSILAASPEQCFPLWNPTH